MQLTATLKAARNFSVTWCSLKVCCELQIFEWASEGEYHAQNIIVVKRVILQRIKVQTLNRIQVLWKLGVKCASRRN